MLFLRYVTLAAAAILCASISEARVVRFVVEQRRPFAPGTSWGSTGPYERLDGIAHFEVDPRDPLNALIVNLDKAPRNVRGQVEFSAPFHILKPVDMAKGNRKLFYGINNRGNQVALRQRIAPGVSADFTGSGGMDPVDQTAVGDGFLFRLGYAYVDAGWHGDGVPAPGRLFARLPVATQPDGSPIVGMTRVELQSAKPTFSQRLIGGFLPEPAADLQTSRSTLTVRARSGDPRTPIPPDRWAFGRCPTGKTSLTASPTDICLFEGFKPDRIYELIYPAKDPIVMGLAHIVTRDVASFLRYQLRDEAGNANPLAMSTNEVGLRRAYASGSSSTGMYVREWLYLGMNEDESHRKVFDAVTIVTGGAYRLFANVAFSHPTFFSGQDQHSDYVSNALPPFTFAVTRDPVTGVTDGILKRPKTDPLVMQIDGDAEFWSWKSSLNVVDGRGNPLPVHPNVRLYLHTSAGHGSNISGLLTTPPERTTCRNLEPGLNGTQTLTRALTIALDDWADRGIAPPPNKFPTVADGTAVTWEAYVRTFPKIPGMAGPPAMNALSVLDFGPLFSAIGGIQTLLPPRQGPTYQVFVPTTDADGIGVGGVRGIHVRAPLGTNVGWNVRQGDRAHDMCGLSASFFPFAATKAERLASGDPRPSLEERYKNHDGFVKAVRKATRELVAERFMLEEDAARYVQAAEESDILRATSTTSTTR